MSDATTQYLTGQMRPSFPALLDGYQRDSDAVMLTDRDVPYGPHPRQAFDFIESRLPWRGTLLYFHAGFWQSRDKALFRFIAPALLAHGIDVALANYPLCPDVTLPALVAATQAAVPAVLSHAARRGRGTGRALIAAGHSAGGHIAVELALMEWNGGSPIAGVVGISGVYDLVPLLNTPLNDRLQLDQVTARALSPLYRLRSGMPPAVFAVGSAETAAFQHQTITMQTAWVTAGNRATALVVEGADHFSILQDLRADGRTLSAILALASPT